MSEPRAVLITGSAGSIGRALVTAFRDNGDIVIGIDRSTTERADDGFIALDLERYALEPQQRERFAAALAEQLGARPLGVLVNNAAVQHLGAFDTLGAARISTSMQVNVLAPMLLSQALLPRLRASRGAIINIGSIHAQASKPGFVAYATSKAALRGLTTALACEIGAAVRCNIIEPAAIETDMLKAGFAEDPAALERLRACHPVGDIGQPEDVAALAVYLASPQACFINGAVIGLDGGIRARLHDPL